MSTIPANEKEIEVAKGIEHNTVTTRIAQGEKFSTVVDIRPLKCYKCNKETDRVMLIVEKEPNDKFGFKNLYYCKTCFKNFLNT